MTADCHSQWTATHSRQTRHSHHQMVTSEPSDILNPTGTPTDAKQPSNQALFEHQSSKPGRHCRPPLPWGRQWASGTKRRGVLHAVKPRGIAKSLRDCGSSDLSARALQMKLRSATLYNPSTGLACSMRKPANETARQSCTSRPLGAATGCWEFGPSMWTAPGLGLASTPLEL